jgi:hypothetical protein
MPPDQVRTRTNRQRQGPHINALTPESRGFCKKSFKAFLNAAAIHRRASPREQLDGRGTRLERADRRAVGFAAS